MVSQMRTSPPRVPSKAFAEAGIIHSDVDHLMIYDAPCSMPGQASRICRSTASKTSVSSRAARPAPSLPSRNTAPGVKLPLNTNGGGLSYMHSGMYGMHALQESVRQMRGTAPAQIPDARISVCHGVGGMFAASSTIMSNAGP